MMNYHLWLPMLCQDHYQSLPPWKFKFENLRSYNIRSIEKPEQFQKLNLSLCHLYGVHGESCTEVVLVKRTSLSPFPLFERTKYQLGVYIFRIRININKITIFSSTLPWQMMTLCSKKKTSTGSMLAFLVIIARKAGPKPETF